MRKTTQLLISLLLLVGALAWYSVQRPTITGGVTAPQPEGQEPVISAEEQIAPVPSESSPKPIVLFCPEEYCMENLLHLINRSEKIHCAFYDLNLEPVIEALKRKNAQVVVDDENYNIDIAFAKHDEGGQLMHDKFCVFDDRTVLTGSFNPTENDNYRNNNNVVVVFSTWLAQNYEDEFQEMWNGRFRKGEKVPTPKVWLGNTLIENYFCPEDGCEDHVIETIKAANESVHFMTFSFTSDAIGDALKDRYWNNVTVEGVFEKSQDNDYTEKPKLESLGMVMRWDYNKNNMHHKVFIIDRKIVITGSYNPTKNGDENNDENILIIHDPEMAAKYEEEFSSVFGD